MWVGHDEVISVFRDPILKLHTTRSWDFLDQQSRFGSKFQHHYHGLFASTDVIIGMIDTGISKASYYRFFITLSVSK